MHVRHVLAVAALLAPAARVRAAEPPARPVEAEAILYGFVVPEQDNFAIADAWVDIRGLHIEGRYNYEALHTGSVFVGANMSAGDTLAVRVTAMLGAVFGDTDGVAPGFRVALTWWKLELSTEDEIIIDPWNVEASFVYSWTELAFLPLAWLRAGIVGQRMRVLNTPLDFQRGLFAGVSLGKLTATIYELNAGWTTPTWVFALAAAF
jgi:hypothetical protein